MRAAGRLVLCLLALGGCADAGRVPPPATLHALRVGDVAARVRIARTPAERRQGLMGVTRLAADEGMLFVYATAGLRSIWMKGCAVALDVAFLDDDARVLEVATLRPPTETGGDVEAVRSARPARYVLEMPAGFFARHGLGEGTRVALPAAALR